MARKSKFRIDPEDFAGAPSVSEGATEETKAEQQEQAEDKQNRHYIQVNMGEYRDYLERMSKYQRKPKTKYIIELIKKDFEANKEAYEHLKAVDDLMKK